MRKEGNDSLLKTQWPNSHPIVSENNNELVRLSERSLPEKGIHLLWRLFTFGEETKSWCNFPTLFRIQALLKFRFLELFISLKIIGTLERWTSPCRILKSREYPEDSAYEEAKTHFRPSKHFLHSYLCEKTLWSQRMDTLAAGLFFGCSKQLLFVFRYLYESARADLREEKKRWNSSSQEPEIVSLLA